MERDKGQNEKSEISKPEAIHPLSLFAGAPQFVYTYQKTEKVITALYMVTGLLPDQEPLKWNLRDLGGRLLSHTNSLKDKFSTRREETLHGIRSLTLEIVSLLDIASFAGLVSEMNAQILKEELGILNTLFTETKDSGGAAKNLVIDRSFFDEIPPPPEMSKDNPEKPSIAPHNMLRRPVSPAYKKTDTSQSNLQSQSSGSVQEKRDKRRKIIMDLIKRKGEITIRDVSVVITDWSDKTIQRELLALVSQGVLKKEGERRWSRYSFVR